MRITNLFTRHHLSAGTIDKEASMNRIEDIVFTVVVSILLLVAIILLICGMVACPFPFGTVALGCILLGLLYIYYMGIKIVWFE